MNFNSLIFWSPKAKNLRLKIIKGGSIFVLFLCTILTYGQAKSKIINGKVVSPNKDVTGVTIQNITSKFATISDFEGNFSIRVSLGDTLVFSAVQFRRKTIPVSKALMNSTFIQIPLEEFVNKLREVTVRPFGLSGNIENDLTNLQFKKGVSAETLDLPNANVKIITQSERKLYEATTGSGLVPLNPILNWISGRTKRLKNKIAIEKRNNQTQKVRGFFIDSLFQSDLGVPIQKIDDFMYFCEVDNDFQELAALGDQLKLWEYLLSRSKLYRKNNDLD